MTIPEIPFCHSVLVVDDEPLIRQIIGIFFRSQGMTVTEAEDGCEALNLVRFRGLRPTFVITDLMMPRIGGLQLVRELRHEIPDLPVLLISGFFDDESALDYIRDRWTDFLPKPFRLPELAKMVKRLLADGVDLGKVAQW